MTPTFAHLSQKLLETFESLRSSRLVLFGGKGGVGKTTLSALAATHFSRSRPTILFSSDPASNLAAFFRDHIPQDLTIESIDAEALYDRFLEANLDSFLELADRGTYFDREEIKRFFELSLPGIDELMAWQRLGELVEDNPQAIVVVDTAPTGHTLRMLSSSDHFRQLSEALQSMQAKHRDLVQQMTRRNVRDKLDDFLEKFEAAADRRRQLLQDPDRSSFVPVFLAEPWVLAQTERLIGELRQSGISVPYAILNLSRHDCECESCNEQRRREEQAIRDLPRDLTVVRAPRACTPLSSFASLEGYLAGESPMLATKPDESSQSTPLSIPPSARLVFFAGKGGVGKTTTASSVALQTAQKRPREKFVLLSVDPAHSVLDVFRHESPPANLSVEIIDTKEKWSRLRDSIGEEISRAVQALTPTGFTVAHDENVMQQLLGIAPPGADEIFAVMRLTHLLDDPSIARVFVDTAPTGHFLRLLDLPRTAGEWVREFMRVLLKYRDLIAPGRLGAELLRASRSLGAFEEALHHDRVAAVVVFRADPIVIEETTKLLKELERREIALAGKVANALTPESSCACDRSGRAAELAALETLGADVVKIDRQSLPPTDLVAIAGLVPMS